MGTVFELNRRGIYSVETAREILPLVYKITSEIDEEMQTLKGQISAAQQLEDLQKAQQLEESAQALLERWESKVLKLGLAPKGMWLVDFDMGQGYFCWKYPELDIKFWHGYNDGYSGRRPIEVSTEESLNI
ncbi:MAG: hypothetical protein RJB66_2197 [Pseudomonadota bacterium]